METTAKIRIEIDASEVRELEEKYVEELRQHPRMRKTPDQWIAEQVCWRLSGARSQKGHWAVEKTIFPACRAAVSACLNARFERQDLGF